MFKSTIGLQPRIMIATCAVMLVFIAMSVGASFFYVSDALLASSGSYLENISQVAASSVGGMIGRDRSLADSRDLLKPLEAFVIGKTGNIALIDGKGYIIACRGTEPFANKLCSYEDLQSLLQSKKRWGVFEGVFLHESKTVVALSKVEDPLAAKEGSDWYIVAAQDVGEVLGSLNVFILTMAVAAAMLLVLLAVTLFILGGIFVKPVRDLREAIGRIGRGDLGYKLDLASGGEFGEIAASINDMTDDLKRTTTSVAYLNEEIAKLRRAEDVIKKLGQLRAGLIRGLSQIKTCAAEKDPERMARTIEDLVDIGRIDEGKFQVKTGVVDIKVLLKDIIFKLEPKVRAKGLDLKLEMPHGKSDVLADPENISRVFRNLITDAMYRTNKGSIEVSVKDLDGVFECSVAYTGKGIAREDLPYVFDMFWQDGSAKAGSGITGLELPITKAIIELHNSTIWVESDLGKGTRFIFRLTKST